jgi:hypothetical protein
MQEFCLICTVLLLLIAAFGGINSRGGPTAF